MGGLSIPIRCHALRSVHKICYVNLSELVTIIVDNDSDIASDCADPLPNFFFLCLEGDQYNYRYVIICLLSSLTF